MVGASTSKRLVCGDTWESMMGRMSRERKEVDEDEEDE
tara:strand:+ start:4867 stop:4980 length:114 start_codon:yes stop_codon:yes gene_type:complete